MGNCTLLPPFAHNIIECRVGVGLGVWIALSVDISNLHLYIFGWNKGKVQFPWDIRPRKREQCEKNTISRQFPKKGLVLTYLFLLSC